MVKEEPTSSQPFLNDQSQNSENCEDGPDEPVNSPLMDISEVTPDPPPSSTFDVPNTVVMTDSIGPTGRKRRATAKAFLDSESHKKQKKAPTPKSEDVESEFAMTWICAECKEAECTIQPDVSDLLICDGICRRVFHFPCVGLQQLPPSDEPFLCTDCTHSRHVCAVCSNYGHDNEDVFQCIKKQCGLFYHEACLSMQNVDMVVVASDNSESRRRFVCPAHSCWTCTQTELREQESMAKQCETGSSTATKKRPSKKGKKKNIVFESKNNSLLTVSV